MLLHISFSAMRTEGLLKLNSRSSSWKWVSNSTLNLSSVNRFLTSEVPPLFLLPILIHKKIFQSVHLCNGRVCSTGDRGASLFASCASPCAAPAAAFPKDPSSVRGSLAIRVGALCQLQDPSVELVGHSRMVSMLGLHRLLQRYPLTLCAHPWDEQPAVNWSINRHHVKT